jgi:hypothetical protein
MYENLFECLKAMEDCQAATLMTAVDPAVAEGDKINLRYARSLTLVTLVLH